MRSLLDVAAEALRAEAPVFTRRNLYFAAARARGEPPAGFDAALRRRLARGPLPGLLPEPSARRAGRPASGRDAAFPDGVLLVDRRAVRDLLLALGAHLVSELRLAVVGVDGTPAPVVGWLARGFAAGLRAPVLYLHDAATVVYPFAVEPLATLVRHQGDAPLGYRDLGLPPLGASARRFGDPALPPDEPILELEAIPPATLLRYCARSASSAAMEARDGPGVAKTALEGAARSP